ncbi:MAG: asparagine synthase (glutamine-hydrolyzing) [Candidatus Hodarchaeales archaeon]|jgi:asparagine synthase (glutamine-hydrolysing)
MCGIAGIYGTDDIDLVQKMTDIISYRGPDDVGYYHDSLISLGHRRLGIIDLLTGKQPIFNEDHSILTVYNGEIYNYQSIRTTLEKKGHSFYTETDTEVIVHAYEEYGTEAFSKFNGMFAFALWDINQKKLFLVRDRFGIKPLYYYEDPKSHMLFFASAIKSILQNKEVPRILDKESFHKFLNLRYCPGPKTMFRGIDRIKPGSFLEISSDGIKEKTFAELNISQYNKNLSEDEAVTRLRQILSASVKRHLISDVPIGVYLSGGIDSSSLVALISQSSENTINTFCMGFGEDDDEIEDAEIVADYFGTSHKSFIVKKNIYKDFPKLIWYADLPKRNLYTYYVSEVVSQFVKVVLSGLGADELFGGYTWKYSFFQENNKLLNGINSNHTSLPALVEAAKLLLYNQILNGSISQDYNLDYLKRILALRSPLEQYLLIKTMDEVLEKEQLKDRYDENLEKFNKDCIRQIYAPFFANNLDPIDQVLLADFSVKAVDDFLFVEDAMSMANSLEARVPFLDNELVAFAFSLPNHLKYRNNEGKYLLRRAMRPLLPKSVFKKEKQGFGPLSYETHFNNNVRDLAIRILPQGSLVKKKFLKKDYINRVLSAPSSPNLAKHYAFIENCMVSEIWYNMYIEPEEFQVPSFKQLEFL